MWNALPDKGSFNVLLSRLRELPFLFSSAFITFPFNSLLLSSASLIIRSRVLCLEASSAPALSGSSSFSDMNRAGQFTV